MYTIVAATSGRCISGGREGACKNGFSPGSGNRIQGVLGLRARELGFWVRVCPPPTLFPSLTSVQETGMIPLCTPSPSPLPVSAPLHTSLIDSRCMCVCVSRTSFPASEQLVGVAEEVEINDETLFRM
jgi:hypothetical protein